MGNEGVTAAGRAARVFIPLGLAVLALFAWDRALAYSGDSLLPRPWQVVTGTLEIAREGLLHRYIISSLFRVTWGFFLAALVGIPFGLIIGWWPAGQAIANPFIQLLRPISPIAWIPLAILWFGLTELGPIFLIWYASVFPIIVSAAAAVRNIQPVYVRAARNFGLGQFELFRRVILPATLPQILTGLRIALGIAWLVVVAAEMVVTNPAIGGLGFMIMDARSAGSRYDLVVAGMVIIGVIGLLLDTLIRQLENFDEVRWGHGR
jgi:NitT/TauT family transport system permease protein